MNLYLTNKVSSIGVVNIVTTLLNDYKLDESYKDCDSLNDVTIFTDYVREFLDMYFREFPIEIDKPTKDYILNRLYNVKGGLEIFNVMNELLGYKDYDQSGDETIDLNIVPEYDFPHLSILNIENLRIDDVGEFKSKLEKAIYVLLFYDEFKLIIKNITILINAILKSNVFLSIKPYYVHSIDFNSSQNE